MLGRRCIHNATTKSRAKEYFFQSSLCYLASNDPVAAQHALQDYEDLDSSLKDSKQGKFARRLIEAVENLDIDALSSTCSEFDKLSTLDPWQASMLGRIKEALEAFLEQDEDSDNDIIAVDL